MEKHHYLVVGGQSGIGAAVTSQLLTSGHSVITVGRSPLQQPQHHERLTHIQADVLADELALPNQITALAGLVYCPGTINLKPFRGLKDEDFIHDFNINLLGAIRSIRTALPLLKSHGNSSVVLFSTVAVQTGMTFHSSIAAAKGAVEGLGRSLAAEFAPTTRVNVIAPSLTQTPLAGRLLDSPQKTEASAQRHPLKRIGDPEDIASLACFLLSPASGWITGQVIHADGGLGTLR